ELRAVERAAAAVGGGARALWALPRPRLGALLDEEHVDTGVGGGIEHLLPAGGGALPAAVQLLEPLECLLVRPRARLVEQRPSDRASGAMWSDDPTWTVSPAPSASGSARKNPSAPDAKIATPRAPSRTNSLSHQARTRWRSSRTAKRHSRPRGGPSSADFSA